MPSWIIRRCWQSSWRYIRSEATLIRLLISCSFVACSKVYLCEPHDRIKFGLRSHCSYWSTRNSFPSFTAPTNQLHKIRVVEGQIVVISENYSPWQESSCFSWFQPRLLLASPRTLHQTHLLRILVSSKLKVATVSSFGLNCLDSSMDKSCPKAFLSTVTLCFFSWIFNVIKLYK